MYKFTYDIVTFIKCVEGHRCLWDKSLESHRDRVERRTAWEDVFTTLDDNYQYLTPSEKRQFEEVVINKWTHIRDTFQRTLKPRQGRPRRKYLHHNNLTFLMKNYMTAEQVQQFENEDADDEYNMKIEVLEDNDGETLFEEEDFTPPVKKKPKKKASASRDSLNLRERKDSEEDNEIDFVGVGEEDTRVMNEDEAFFASLLPTVVKYNEDERLDFRLEVLGVMKNIKQKRKWTGSD